MRRCRAARRATLLSLWTSNKTPHSSTKHLADCASLPNTRRERPPGGAAASRSAAGIEQLDPAIRASAPVPWPSRSKQSPESRHSRPDRLDPARRRLTTPHRHSSRSRTRPEGWKADRRTPRAEYEPRADGYWPGSLTDRSRGLRAKSRGSRQSIRPRRTPTRHTRRHTWDPWADRCRAPGKPRPPRP